MDAETMTAWAKKAWLEARGIKTPRTIVRFRAGPRMPLADVLSAVNSVYSAGLYRVTYLGIELAPPEIRKARRLPR